MEGAGMIAERITRAELEPVEECTFTVEYRDGTSASVHYEPVAFVSWWVLAPILSVQIDGGRVLGRNDFQCVSSVCAEFDAGEDWGVMDCDIRYYQGIEIQGVDMSPRPGNLEYALDEGADELMDLYSDLVPEDCLLCAMRFADELSGRETKWRVLR